LDEFLGKKLIFGVGGDYGSLLTPSYTCLSEKEAIELQDDLLHLWTLYKTLNRLYLDSLSGRAPDWIRQYTEQGLPQLKIDAHRITAAAGLEPRLCRVDYVSLGRDRKIAEIQWKSGGLGLFFGIQDVYSRVIPPETGTRVLGHLATHFSKVVADSAKRAEPTAANAVVYVWFKSEHYLQGLLKAQGVRYFPVQRDELFFRVLERDDGYFISDGGRLFRLDFLYGRESGHVFRQGVVRLALAAIAGKIWVESPLNFMYRQKWGLVLPFLREFKGLFDERLRRILIPGALLSGQPLDLSPLTAYLDHPERDRLLKIRKVAQIADLPASFRQALVLKCGAGRGGLHSHGKGVFRIGGSRASARKVLDLIEQRITELGEPWIVQQYADQTYAIPVSLPRSPARTTVIQAHARFMVYGGTVGESAPVVMGGLGNYGAHWKVSGRSPGVGKGGAILGTAFNDLRSAVQGSSPPRPQTAADLS
jgi:hypothetical protein